MSKSLRIKLAYSCAALAALGLCLAFTPEQISHLPAVERFWIWIYGFCMFGVGIANPLRPGDGQSPR